MHKVFQLLLQIVVSYIYINAVASQCPAGQSKVTGGVYEPNAYSNSFVIREVVYVGPKGCIRQCLHQMGCDAVNYGTNYTCELLVTNPRDEIWNVSNSFFTRVDDWKMVRINIKNIDNCDLPNVLSVIFFFR